MQTFTPLEYVMIATANHMGHDKLSWNERIQWTKDNANNLDQLVNDADEPTLYKKSIRALDDALNKRPSGFLVGLDATASGIQIMSAMAGCVKGCEHTNLIDTGSRQDLYGSISAAMNKMGANVNRTMLKHPIMTHFYGSTAQPKAVFGEGKLLTQFYKTLNQELEGATCLMNIMQAAWNPEAYSYNWTLPDGHKAGFKVMVPVDKKIEVDELDHATFTHRAYVNIPSKSGLSLAANIIHSIDGFICRKMYEMADKQGWELLTIHDSFWCHPNYANKMRQNYIDIFTKYINMDLFNSIMEEVTGSKSDWEPLTENIHTSFGQANYALS